MTANTNSNAEALLYQRLYISKEDLSMAAFSADHLLKKGWHFAPWEGRRRWSTYMQQPAFATAFVTAHARPFTKSYGWPPFPKSLVNYNDADWELHERLMQLRNQVYAHSDSVSHRVRPTRIVEYPSAIVGSPPLRITKKDLKRGIRMIAKLQSSVSTELRRLISVIELEA
jgi:hypothetical protein